MPAPPHSTRSSAFAARCAAQRPWCWASGGGAYLGHREYGVHVSVIALQRLAHPRRPIVVRLIIPQTCAAGRAERCAHQPPRWHSTNGTRWHARCRAAGAQARNVTVGRAHAPPHCGPEQGSHRLSRPAALCLSSSKPTRPSAAVMACAAATWLYYRRMMRWQPGREAGKGRWLLGNTALAGLGEGRIAANQLPMGPSIGAAQLSAGG